MRSGVGAVCILVRAARAAADSFLALLPAELVFTGAAVFLVCDAPVEWAVAAGFAAVDFAGVGFVAAGLLAGGFVAGVDWPSNAHKAGQTHKPPASNSPPAARKIIG